MKTDLRGWLRCLSSDAEEGGIREFVGGAYNGVYFSLTSRYPFGTNVYDLDWDLLIVLDACRVDALREVAPEFDFIEDVGSVWSVGSSSHEWLCKTFNREYADEISETVYVSTNPNTPRAFSEGERPPTGYRVPAQWTDWDVVDKGDFKLLRQLHRHDYDEFADTFPPDLVTDHTIHAARTTDFERMVVHYFQPHRPHIGTAYPSKRPVTAAEDQPWDAIRNGDATEEDVWELYLDNLRLALDSVGRLLENVDADTVAITADHGELFGEWGLYGHPEGVVNPNLKKVPWALTTASDERTSDPTVDVDRQKGDVDVQERLENLGYV